MRKRSRGELSEEEIALFREAVSSATPLRVSPRARSERKSPPPAVRARLDVRDTRAESNADPISPDQHLETGEEASFLRNGLGRDVLRKLRRGNWLIQDWIDLHGLNRDQAGGLLADFLADSRRQGLRCVRVVHGKGLGSPGREPVLKGKVRQWLAQRDEVLAFCEAPANQGGSGALLILLRA